MTARLLGGLAIVSMLIAGAALVRYEQARAAWRVHGAAIDTAGYDASASDAAYGEVEDALRWVERATRASAACLVIAAVALGRSRPRLRRSDGSRARRAAARALDVGTLALVIALSRLRIASPGATECLAWLAPATVLAVLLAAASQGATIGDRATGLATRVE